LAFWNGLVRADPVGKIFQNRRRPEGRTSSVNDSSHITRQGGVGKSLVASVLAQYFRHHGREIHCIDSDPVNAVTGEMSKHTIQVESMSLAK